MTLNARQRKFCELYAANGNATESAKLAGYSENSAKVEGSRLLTNDNVLEYIRELSAPAENKRIADVQDIKEFWTAIMRDDGLKLADRIKSSELLAKSAAMFIEKKELSIAGNTIKTLDDFYNDI